MKPSIIFRILAVIFVLFAAGHTYGFLNFTPPTAAGLAVQASMNSVPLEDGFTYGRFYTGFGLQISAYMFFSALLSWHLAGLAPTAPRSIVPLAWSFFTLQLAGLALACIFFPAVPAAFSAITVLCCGAAAWSLSRSGKAAAARAL